MKNWLKNRWADFVQFNKRREIVHALSLPPDQFANWSESRFNEAKKLSDFVGMTTRLAFALFAARYFFSKAPITDGAFSYIYGLCAVSAYGLSFVLARHIMMIIFLWEVRDARAATHWLPRTVLYTLAVVTTIILYLGLFSLAQDLASAGALAPSPKG